jgi:hypothetical protein
MGWTYWTPVCVASRVSYEEKWLDKIAGGDRRVILITRGSGQ